MESCKICGAINCKKHSSLFTNVKKVYGFSGSSPPEIFIGKWNYPNVFIGVLSPQEHGNTEILSSQEIWHQKRLQMPEIKALRSKLVYGRTQSNIRKPLEKSNFITSIQEVAMTSSSISTEFKFHKPIQQNQEKEETVATISRAANLKSLRIEENPKIEKKVDYLVNDTDVKSKTAMLELEKSGIKTQNIIKILSAGLLGLGNRRKFVPTRWSITAVDSNLSSEKLKKIKLRQEISEFQVFNAEYLGNHYEFLLLPDKFSFEVLEINYQNMFWHDYESFFPRKTYAESVTGAYYVNRLALCEYLERVNRQASCLVFREINPEIYTQSMGVGVLREISREAFSNTLEKFSSLNEALSRIQERLKLPLQTFTDKSIILKNYQKQKRITNWLGI